MFLFVLSVEHPELQQIQHKNTPEAVIKWFIYYWNEI